MDSCYICDPKSKYNNCICNKNFINFEKTNIDINSNDVFDITKKWTISTMTLCCSLNEKIDIDKYKIHYAVKETKKYFYNCINIYTTVKYQNKNKVSIKIFKNGNIQLAGLTNVRSANYAVRKIYNRLKKISAFLGPNHYISNLRICMINSDFKISKNIKQGKLCEILDNDKTLNARYSFNPSKYPGINVKFQMDDEKITCAIFRPGSIMITGGNNISNYKIIAETLIKLFSNNFNILY